MELGEPLRVLGLDVLGVAAAHPPIAAQEPDSVEVTVAVRDAGTTEALAGVVIELSGLRERHVTGDDGTATFDVPAGRYRLTVRKSGYATIERTIEDDLPVARAIRTIVMMRRPAESDLDAPASLLVQVTEFASGHPIEAAEVSLVGESERLLTNTRGMAWFRDVRRSLVEVAVQRIGYATRTEPVLLEAERTTLAKVAMTVEAVPLAPLEVEVRSRFLEKQGVYWRIDHDRVMHVFDTDDLIERMRGSPLLAHAFTRLPGLFVWYARGAPYFLGRRRCEIPVYWDGIRGPNPYGHFDDIPPEAVAFVEVYTGVRTPARFQRWPGDINDCGAIVFWSKRRAGRGPRNRERGRRLSLADGVSIPRQSTGSRGRNPPPFERR